MYNKINLKVLNLIKRRRRYINLFLDIVPESKTSMGKKQAEIQKIIIEQMKKRNLKTIQSNIAIEIVTYCSEKNPPRIEKFVKNLLDLMHKKEILERNEDADFLPFEEDKNIKYLSVRYIFLPGKSQTYVRIRPFSSFISDLYFIDTQIKGHKPGKEEFISLMERFESLLANKETYVKNFSEEVYEYMMDSATLDVQKSLSSDMAISPLTIRLMYPTRATPAFIKVAYKKWSNLLIELPIRIKLSEIPTKKNTAKAYKAQVRDQLASYVERKPIFKNLKAPVIVTVYYSPPVEKKGFSYKDIDNIMLDYILPSFNDVFNPPLSVLNLHMKMNDEFSKAIPKSLNGSAMGYVVIELPKSEERMGFLSIGFEVVDHDRKGLVQWVDEKVGWYIKNSGYLD